MLENRIESQDSSLLLLLTEHFKKEFLDLLGERNQVDRRPFFSSGKLIL